MKTLHAKNMKLTGSTVEGSYTEVELRSLQTSATDGLLTLMRVRVRADVTGQHDEEHAKGLEEGPSFAPHARTEELRPRAHPVDPGATRQEGVPLHDRVERSPPLLEERLRRRRRRSIASKTSSCWPPSPRIWSL
jgi:hypothetical protein